MIYDPRDRAFALSQPLPLLPAVPEDTAAGEFMVGLQGAFRAFQAEEQSDSRQRMLREALQPYLDAYRAETGQALDNPYEPRTLSADPRTLELRGTLVAPPPGEQLAAIGQRYENARQSPGDRGVSRLPPFPNEGRLTELAKKRALAITDEAERAAAVRATGGAGSVGATLGTLAAAATDPVNLASMAIGAPPAAGILRTMAIEGGIGAGAEALIQPGVARWKAELGKDHGFADMLANVAAGAVGAGAFAGFIKGGVRAAGAAYDALRPFFTREQRAAIEALDSLDVYERRDPFKEARRIRRTAERTGEPPSARFGEQLFAGEGAPSREIDVTSLPRDVTRAAPESRGSPEPAAEVVTPRARDVTVEQTDAGDQLVIPGAEQVGQRQVLERRMAARDLRAGQQGLEGRGLFDETARARQADLLDMPPAEQRAVHMRAVEEAEASVAAGQAPEGPAIKAIDQAEPDLELPVYSVQTAKGRTVRRRGPMDLLTWLRTIGGIRDDGGELRARDLQKLNRGRSSVEFAGGEAFLGRLVNDEGLPMDEATLRAWEAGYFPGHPDRPTPDDLLEAIDRTVAAGNDLDRRVWSEHDAELVERVRGRVDPDSEAFAREVLGDEAVDDALELLDSPINLEIDPATVAPAVDLGDQVELATLEALQRELDVGDWDATVDVLDPTTGEPIEGGAVRRSARQAWKETEQETAAWQDAAACMTMGAANAA